MKRRSFLTIMGAASVAPAMPLRAISAPTASVGYSRYMYGLAVFQARTRASITTADLVTRLKISTLQAETMLREMRRTGVVRASLGGAVGAARASQPHVARSGLGKLGKEIRVVAQEIDRIADDIPPESSQEPVSAPDRTAP